MIMMTAVRASPNKKVAARFQRLNRIVIKTIIKHAVATPVKNRTI